MQRPSDQSRAASVVSPPNSRHCTLAISARSERHCVADAGPLDAAAVEHLCHGWGEVVQAILARRQAQE